VSMGYRYRFKPEIEDIYLYMDTPVIIWSTSYGHLTMATLNDQFFADISLYSDEADMVWKMKVGKRIRPMWQKEILRWDSNGRKMTQKEYQHDREYEDGRRDYAIHRIASDS
jgi:hypothetical protein